MNVSPLFIFIMGVLIGFLLALYVFSSSGKKDTPEPQQSGASLDELLRSQIAYQQTQNMIRQLQLEAAKQEQEFVLLDQSRFKLLAESQRLTQYDVRKALEQITREPPSC